jgi:hypothetical protein
LLKELPMYKPPLVEQEEFAAIVDNVETLRQRQEEAGKALDCLFDSLIQRAFRGDLVK